MTHFLCGLVHPDLRGNPLHLCTQNQTANNTDHAIHLIFFHEIHTDQQIFIIRTKQAHGGGRLKPSGTAHPEISAFVTIQIMLLQFFLKSIPAVFKPVQACRISGYKQMFLAKITACIPSIQLLRIIHRNHVPIQFVNDPIQAFTDFTGKVIHIDFFQGIVLIRQNLITGKRADHRFLVIGYHVIGNSQRTCHFILISGHHGQPYPNLPLRLVVECLHAGGIELA